MDTTLSLTSYMSAMASVSTITTDPVAMAVGTSEPEWASDLAL